MKYDLTIEKQFRDDFDLPKKYLNEEVKRILFEYKSIIRDYQSI